MMESDDNSCTATVRNQVMVEMQYRVQESFGSYDRYQARQIIADRLYLRVWWRVREQVLYELRQDLDEH
jgi:hypothetical protein